MSDSNIYPQLLELTRIASANQTLLERIDKDIPNLYGLINGVQTRVAEIEKLRAEESGESSGRSWVIARATMVVGAIITVCSGILTALWNWLSAS